MREAKPICAYCDARATFEGEGEKVCGGHVHAGASDEYTWLSPQCWTCGANMDERTYRVAPREPSDESLRTCVSCFDLVHSTHDPLAIMNMVRHAAGVSIVEPLGDSR